MELTKSHKRQLRMERARRIARGLVQLMGFRRNKARLAEAEKHVREWNEGMVRRSLIDHMTNYQRNQWGRAGYPQDIETLKAYLRLPHHKKNPWRKDPETGQIWRYGIDMAQPGSDQTVRHTVTA